MPAGLPAPYYKCQFEPYYGISISIFHFSISFLQILNLFSNFSFSLSLLSSLLSISIILFAPLSSQLYSAVSAVHQSSSLFFYQFSPGISTFVSVLSKIQTYSRRMHTYSACMKILCAAHGQKNPQQIFKSAANLLRIKIGQNFHICGILVHHPMGAREFGEIPLI